MAARESAGKIVLRAASVTDIPLLRQWDRESHVVTASGSDGGWDWDAEIAQIVPWREMLVAELDSRPIGFVQIIDPFEEETRYWGDCEKNLRAIDIWIGEPDCLGKGHGTQMMRDALVRCFAAPSVTGVLIDPLVSNEGAIRFYKRIGFRFVEFRRFGDDECAVLRFERASLPGLLVRVS